MITTESEMIFYNSMGQLRFIVVVVVVFLKYIFIVVVIILATTKGKIYTVNK